MNPSDLVNLSDGVEIKVTPLSVTDYNSGYWAAVPDVVKNACQLTDPAAKQTALIELAQQGYIIDPVIMLWGWDPDAVMKARNEAGYAWTPSLLQPAIQIIPGLGGIGNLVPYNSTPPPGSCLVYWPHPPNYKPAPPPPPTSTTFTVKDPLGPSYPNAYNVTGDGPNIPVGTSFTQDNHTYTKTIIGHSPFAPNGNVTAWIQS